MPITIPARLLEKLHSDSTYEGYIHTLLNNTAALITEKADFFPEYTLHGWTHIQAVLNHADKLIPDVTMEVLTGRDAAILIAAVVLHDMGMFLYRAGVRKLLTGPRRTTKTARLDKLDWKAEWDRYIREIRRYPEEKLLYHFGMSHAIEEPDLEKGDFSDLDLLIVGDFLRRHHHRIAHEIAMGTMPGDTDVDVLRVGMDALGNQAFNAKDRKCIGILARSHGMPIRATKDYIDWAVGRQYQEKLTYLMAVLRIADALDADERRAPDTVRKLQGIRTPVSVKEWTWNQRIVRTELDWNEGADYKYVECEPESTTEFVHLEEWLNWVQRELDTCWAVLSEVCDTQKYRLSIHRIESNILEEERRESYSEKFITKEARLKANPELLKLLVGPLYDDDPSCGVRELLQNAVDACNERAHLEGDGYRGQVEIRLDTKAKTLTVTDNGIGMDENVLLNYYLSAGASYRTSDQWFVQFATGRESNIVRTGRFGVGVLATFLLGNQVEVTTRHMDDELGYTFEFGLEPKGLDIRRPDATPEIGTTITVTLKEDGIEKLQKDYAEQKKWLNWYRFAEPSVRYWVDGEEYVSDKPFVPQDDRKIAGWFELEGTEYEMVRWGYPGDGFFCNGIRIPEGMDKVHCYADMVVPAPSVSIIDKKGQLPLELSRRTLGSFQQAGDLKKEMIRYAWAQLLMADWSSVEAAAERFENGIWEFRNHPGFLHAPCICCREGYTILNSGFLLAGGCDEILMFFHHKGVDMKKIVSMIQRMGSELPFLVYPEPNGSGEEAWYNTEPFPGFDIRLIDPKYYKHRIDQVWVSEEWYNTIDRYDLFIRSIRKRENEWWDRVELPSDEMRSWWDMDLCPAISLVHLNATRRRHEDQDWAYFLQRYMGGTPWIPYKMEERRKKFPKAFKELEYYINRILADREKERGVT